jgi:hypothetical protein
MLTAVCVVQASTMVAPREVARAHLCLGIAHYVRADLPAAREALERARVRDVV